MFVNTVRTNTSKEEGEEEGRGGEEALEEIEEESGEVGWKKEELGEGEVAQGGDSAAAETGAERGGGKGVGGAEAEGEAEAGRKKVQILSFIQFSYILYEVIYGIFPYSLSALYFYLYNP